MGALYCHITAKGNNWRVKRKDGGYALLFLAVDRGCRFLEHNLFL